MSDMHTYAICDAYFGDPRMNASSFHRAIKEITSDSPIQYLKEDPVDQGQGFDVTRKHEGLHSGIWKYFPV